MNSETQFTTAQSLEAAMRRALMGSDVIEVTASGEFTLPAHRATLFPGAVYGFAVQLDQIELGALYEEARARRLSCVDRLESFQPIEGTLYPLYWGKDKCLGARPYQHLNDPAKTGAIRLSTYDALRGKTIACVSLVVSDYAAAERILRSAYPSMLKTSMVQYGPDGRTRKAVVTRTPLAFVSFVLSVCAVRATSDRSDEGDRFASSASSSRSSPCNPSATGVGAFRPSFPHALYLSPSWAASSVGRAPPLHGGRRRGTAPQDARVAPTIGPAVCNPVCKPWGRDTGVSAEVDERRPLIMAFPSDSRQESHDVC